MKVRGERECRDCGTRWSYYETGSVECPDCGSLESVGLDERTRHTASAGTLDLTPARSLLEERSLRAALERAADLAREYLRGRGFVEAGDLRPLPDTYLAASELRHVAGLTERSLRLDDEAEVYLLSLLRGADQGSRPAPEDVPAALRAGRGLAYARAVEDYRREVRAHVDLDADPPLREALGRLEDHRRRVQALDGDVAPATVETLVAVTRDVHRYVDGEEDALAIARSRLDGLGTARE